MSTAGSMNVADAVTTARGAAADAAARAGVTVAEIHDLEGEAAVGELFDRVWGTDGAPVLPANPLHAIAHAGNYLSGAWRGERLVGAAFGFLGRDEDGLFLHSHMTGVDPTCGLHGVGFALKLHQRAWALSIGLDRIEWTFDPLVRRNAYFNLVKLGTEITGYHENFYGEMPDGINAGDESDRVLVLWTLASQRVDRAATNGLDDPDVPALLRSGAEILVDLSGDRPIVGEATGDVLLCRVPEDIVALRRRDREAALEWRHAVRAAMGRALQGDYRATAISRDGWYVLERER